jgi:hypothetical protein
MNKSKFKNYQLSREKMKEIDKIALIILKTERYYTKSIGKIDFTFRAEKKERM